MSAVRRSLGQRVFYVLCRTFMHAALLVCYGYTRFGLDNVPREGGALLVSNHQSYLDPPIVGICVRGRQFHPLARVGLFKNPLLRAIIAALNAIPIDQDRGDTGAIKATIARLEAGGVVCVFPEGSRTYDGRMQPFQRGAAVILKRSRCPVIPVAIDGAFEAWPRTRRFPRRLFHRIGVQVGRPIDHDELLKDGADAALRRLETEVRALRDDLRRRLRRPPIDDPPRGDDPADPPADA